MRWDASLQEKHREEPAVELRGADFDWGNWAGLPPDLLAQSRVAAAALLQDPAAAKQPCLDWQRLARLQPKPGKGNEGSGKVSTGQISPAAAQPDDKTVLSPGASASFGAPDTRLALGDAPETANGVQQVVVALPEAALEESDPHARHAVALALHMRLFRITRFVCLCCVQKLHMHAVCTPRCWLISVIYGAQFSGQGSAC